MVPFMYILLVLLALGFARKQLNQIISLFLRLNITVNGFTIYFFPLVAIINLIAILYLYGSLIEMQEPLELMAKTAYFEKLYRTYRNFLINIASVVLIFQIFYAGRQYAKYAEARDLLQEVKALAGRK